uniref:mRNA (guanine-N(7))-methyltransferase n=1 Tax=Auxenochlorella protothecoides TaxID=3075 RepID=A0A1D2AEU8_AUXPR
MDRQALEYTREHYNKHSNQYGSTQEALAARASGPGAPLKKFHNYIKRHLINRFAKGAPRLLDLACGRGGDIWKWIDAGIPCVKGIDLSPHEIEEARARFSEAQARKSELSLDYSFEASPELGLSECKESERYDAVTCMFAVHYFFVAEKALKQFLHNVSINLKPGGYFFGTVPDGRRVNECIRGSLTYQSPMLTVEARWKGSPGCFGSAYICAIGDTVTGSEKGTEGSLEYLVYSNVFVGVAAQYGLVPVLQYDMPSLENVLDPADANKPLKHFLPRFPGSHPSLEQASRLFATFVFQKQGEYPAAEPGARKQDAAEPTARKQDAAEPAIRSDETSEASQPHPRLHEAAAAAEPPAATLQVQKRDRGADLAPKNPADDDNPMPGLEAALKRTRR